MARGDRRRAGRRQPGLPAWCSPASLRGAFGAAPSWGKGSWPEVFGLGLLVSPLLPPHVAEGWSALCWLVGAKQAAWCSACCTPGFSHRDSSLCHPPCSCVGRFQPRLGNRDFCKHMPSDFCSVGVLSLQQVLFLPEAVLQRGNWDKLASLAFLPLPAPCLPTPCSALSLQRFRSCLELGLPELQRSSV